MTEKETVKRLRELADEIDKSTTPKSAEPEWTPEWTLVPDNDGFCQVRFRGVKQTDWLPTSRAVAMVNAMNSFEAMKDVCESASKIYRGSGIGQQAREALRLERYDADGRLKDG